MLFLWLFRLQKGLKGKVIQRRFASIDSEKKYIRPFCEFTQKQRESKTFYPWDLDTSSEVR